MNDKLKNILKKYNFTRELVNPLRLSQVLRKWGLTRTGDLFKKLHNDFNGDHT